MKLHQEPRGKYLLVRAEGKLDASWADYFTDTLLGHVREGAHHLIVNASGLEFLSSAGIRSLLQVYKALNTVHGSFCIIEPTPFVEQILRTAGFQALLGEGLPQDISEPGSGGAEAASEDSGIDTFPAEDASALTLVETASWRPWAKVDRTVCRPVVFQKDMAALGIGSSAPDFDRAREHFGEFLAVAGHVVYQPAGEQEHPDYLVSEKQYVPEMQCIQALSFSGRMSGLLRFAPAEEVPFHTVSGLMENILARTGGNAAGFVVLGEIEGLVGAVLIRSPGLIAEDRELSYPEIRDWLSFCGERSYAHQQTLLAGLVCRAEICPQATLVRPLPTRPEIAAHIHAAVFPHQPLQNGRIELEPTVAKFINGPPPLAILHLLDDHRPVVGLGESALIRGACWFGPLQNPEDLS